MNEYKDLWHHRKIPREMKTKPELWAQLIEYWEREETKTSSATHSTNRKSDRKGKGPATHNLGATSKATRALQLYQKKGTPPSNLELIKDAHTNRKTGEIQDPLAREIVESVERLGEQYLQSQPTVEGTPPATEVPIEKINEFTYEVTPKNKGRVFGLPEDSSTSSVSSFRFHGDSGLRAQNTELLERMEAMEAQRKEDADRFEAMEAKRREDAERFQELREADAAKIREMQEKMDEFFRTFRQQ